MNKIEPRKMKVAELRAQLQAGNLKSTEMLILVQRLRGALETEAAEETEGEAAEETEGEAAEETEGEAAEETEGKAAEKTEGEAAEESEASEEEQENDSEEEEELEKAEIEEEEAALQVEKELQDEDVPMVVVENKPSKVNDKECLEEVIVEEQETDPEEEEEVEEEQDVKFVIAEIEEEEDELLVKKELQGEVVEEDETFEGHAEAWVKEVLMEEIKYEYDNVESIDIKEEPIEVKVEATEEWRRGEKRAVEVTKMTPVAKRSRPDVEDKYEFDKSLVVLDRYNSDTSLIISEEDRLSAYPLTGRDYGSVWHGVRATYGFTKGKVFYEVEVMEHPNVPHLKADEDPHVIRVGWSVDDTGLMLGEEPLSYGYEGTAKASSNLRFKNYGIKFGKGDVVGCFLNLDVQPAVISFTVNGEHQGIAYKICQRKIGDAALFPHIVTKNSSFQVNFGQEDPWFKPVTGYTALQKVPLEERVLATQGPEKRKDCETTSKIAECHDTEEFISEVGKRPARWDRSNKQYKNKKAKVCCSVSLDYEEKNAKEKLIAGMHLSKFYRKKSSPTPKGVKGFVIRGEPQSDSDVSDISVDDIEDEYYPSQDDSEVLRQDLMIDYQAEMGVPRSTVSTIWKNRDKYRQAAASTSSTTSLVLRGSRDSRLDTMEDMLIKWIEDRTQRKMPISMGLVQERALSLWEDLQATTSTTSRTLETFTASRGWFQRFRERAGLHNVTMSGEAASADEEAASAFPAFFKTRVEEGGFTPKQVFNINETGLFWKKMPTRTYISREEKHASGFKAAKDRLTVALGGNAEGDVKLKPLLVYYSANPRAFKNVNKTTLPVVWTANSKAWVTFSIFHEYVTGYLSQFVERYTKKENLSNKILLVVDNAPGHPPSMVEWCTNIHVCFLPPNTTPVLQPMDQGVIATFKKYYTRRTMRKLNRAMDSGTTTVRAYWRSFNIKMAVEHIVAAWEEVAPVTMNAVWHKLWPEAVHSFHDFPVPDQGELNKELVAIANAAQLGDAGEQLEATDIEDLLASHAEDLSNEDLRLLQQQQQQEESQQVEFPSPSTLPRLSITSLCGILQAADKLEEMVMDLDPDFTRSFVIRGKIRQSVDPYKQLLQEKKADARQSKMEDFFLPRPSTSQQLTKRPLLTLPTMEATPSPPPPIKEAAQPTTEATPPSPRWNSPMTRFRGFKGEVEELGL
ncbi:uncharacterized protein LOC143021925 isoform X5 [Oratosquilla oratoria]|uniref:uncharacterized protein LOC143021925 isoform X5 n=1 Tax=Oratosquilla oratoria TaxID=337810 RepID=UPI003F76734B